LFNKPDSKASLIRSQFKWIQDYSDAPIEIKNKITAALTPAISGSSNYHGVNLHPSGKYRASSGNLLKGGYFVLQADAAYGADLLRKRRKTALRTYQAVSKGFNFATKEDYASARAIEIESRSLNESDDGIGSIEIMITKLEERVEKTCATTKEPATKKKATTKKKTVRFVVNDLDLQ
jgi:hypothetical protein